MRRSKKRQAQAAITLDDEEQPMQSRLLLLLLTLGITLPIQATELVGRWVLDQERTAAIQPEQPQENN